MSTITGHIKVSVIMSVYNNAGTIKEAIESIIGQSFTNWEMIVCDDCSTDDSYAIISDYSKRFTQIQVFKNPENQGLPASLNSCIERSCGEYIARMDGDDISLPERFKCEVEFLDSHPEYSIVSGGMICFDEEGDWGFQNHEKTPQIHDFIYGTVFNHAPCMMRRRDLLDVGMYTVKPFLRRGQDYYLWHKFYINHYSGYNLQFPIYKVRDDMKAAKKRSIRESLGCMRAQFEIYNNLNIPLIYYFRLLRPLFVALLPRKIYIFVHKRNLQVQKQQ